MGRKKKENGNNNLEKSEKERSIHTEAKRSIMAVFLFALSVIFILAFFEKAGALGRFLHKALELAFGWGKWFSPPLLLVAGIVLLYRKETLFYVTKLIGLFLAFFSILGFLHLYIDPNKMLQFAQQGVGGGYAGYAVAFSVAKLTGTLAGTVILFALLVASLIVVFNFSLMGLAQKNFPWKKKEGEEVFVEIQKPEEKKEETEEEPEFVQEPEEERVYIEEKKIPRFSVKQLPQPFGTGSEKKPGVVKSARWQYPPLDLLESSAGKAHGGDVSKKARIIHDTLQHFGIEVELGEIQVGPTVTQYSFRPAVGVKLSKITALSNDLALALAAHPIRIEAPIPGKSLIGIEVPNDKRAEVRLRSLLQSDSFKSRKSNLTLALGEDVSGNYILSDLKKMPHLMIAGSTGTGKSVCINAIILTLLYQNSPQDLRLVLIDPKRVELSLYNGIPHLLANTIVENGKALNAFKWAISEMERRYRVFQDTGSRDLESFNQKVETGEKRRYTDEDSGQMLEEEIGRLPHIVIIIDELADLMASHGKEVEGAIIRLAQMARAVGIHLIVSTQRPSVEVLTGLIKANITTRIAFKVATQIDSRTILDASGAEKLLGNGDLLLLSSQSAKLKRLQGVLVSEAEVKKVVGFVEKQKDREKKSQFEEESNLFSEKKSYPGSITANNPQYEDTLYDEAKRVVIESKKASSSLLQRRLRVGYARAARLMDMLEEQGVISPGKGSKPRDILAEGKTEPEGVFASQSEEKIANKIEVEEDEKEKNKAENEIGKNFYHEEERNKWQI
jgi:S-DNA-T family DNA segregation ATPase FtsK/SpoIIIE